MQIRIRILSELATFLVLGVVMSALFTYSLSLRGARVAPNPSLETQVQRTLKALAANSRETLVLVEKLQSEATARIERIQDTEKQLAALQQQRTLLDLTPEQRRALESLVQRPTSFWSLFATWEFWISGVFVNVVIGSVFYWLGIRRGRAK